MKEKILLELKQNGIDKYKLKKSYNELKKIKKRIKKEYKHEIDWIEIENIGSKYIIKYEPRIENKKIIKKPYRNLIAKKNAIIYEMSVTNGQIMKFKTNYVSKGDVIVSGYIYLNDKIVNTVSAHGKIYGEVWYTLNIKYPLHSHYKKETKIEKNVFVFNFLNKKIELFNKHKFKNKIIKNRQTLIKNIILPISLVKEKQIKTILVDKKYNKKEATKEALKLGKQKLKKKLKEDEFIINYKILEKNINKDELEVKIFYRVCEDITSYQEIDKYEENDDTN